MTRSRSLDLAFLVTVFAATMILATAARSGAQPTTTTTLAPGPSFECQLELDITNATFLRSLQFDIDYSGVSGGFPPAPCTILQPGLPDTFDNGTVLDIAWADFGGFTGPVDFANCTFIATQAPETLQAEDFPIIILDHAGANPPAPANPAPEVGLTIGECTAVDPECGNGVREAGEDCDDGNLVEGDECPSSCTFPTTTTTTTLPATTTTLPPTTTVPETTTTLASTTTTLPGTTTVPPTTTTTLPPPTTTTLPVTTTSFGATTTSLPPTTTTTLPGVPECGDPVALTAFATAGTRTNALTASDALFTLRTAVGSQTCALCVCDVNSSGTITASDALVVLRRAVGQSVPLQCPVCSP
jgi:cysteine-rich repeat protein